MYRWCVLLEGLVLKAAKNYHCLTFDSGDRMSATEGLSVARVVLRMLATPAPTLLPLPLPAAGGGMLRSLPLFITSAMMSQPHLRLSLYKVAQI